MMHTLSDSKQNSMGNKPLEDAGVDIIVGKVISVNPNTQSMTIDMFLMLCS